ncbi:MAG: hypothetical protein ACI9QD_000196 [Thermoproteota archaeon]|jgi:hypothetical protein
MRQIYFIVFITFVSTLAFGQDAKINGSKNKCESKFYGLYENRELTQQNGQFKPNVIVTPGSLGRDYKLKSGSVTHRIYIKDDKFPKQHLNLHKKVCNDGECSKTNYQINFDSKCNITTIGFDASSSFPLFTYEFRNVPVSTCSLMYSSMNDKISELNQSIPKNKDDYFKILRQWQGLKDHISDTFNKVKQPKSSNSFYEAYNFLKLCNELDQFNLIPDNIEETLISPVVDLPVNTSDK